MAEGMTTVPTPLFEQFMAWVKSFGEPQEVKEAQTETGSPPDEYTAQIAEKEGRIEALEAEVAQMQEAQDLVGRIEHFTSEIGGESDEVYTLLAGLPEEDAAVLVTRFKALRAEVELRPEEDAGAGGADSEAMSPGERINAVVMEYAGENSVPYNVAFEAIRTEQPELFNSEEGE